MELQHTISRHVALSGRGLFTGTPGTLTFRPAPENHGIVFVRTDLGQSQVPALVGNVVKKDRRTTLRCGEASVDTTEHCMSAVAGLNIDNLIIELDAAEVPAMDGSAQPFLEALSSAGIAEQEAPRKRVKITEPVVVRQGDSMVMAMPSDEPGMQVVYDLDYSQTASVGRQLRAFDLRNGDYAHEIAPARTFCLEHEAVAMKAAGIGAHLSEDDVLVIGTAGPLGANRFRYPDEPVRHKIVDLIGDLYLLGAPIQGRIIAFKSGHALNHALVRAIIKQTAGLVRAEMAASKTIFDIRRLSRILPHRYPMLLVDRVIEIEGDHRAVGIKNVTINEPFFQGHYPGTPIMPGVLVVEAMAQLSGVLIGQSLEHTGKLAVLMSLDRVKLRKSVTPGDQLVLEAESIRIRGRIAHMRCKAFIGKDLAAEAEVKFMLVDDEQQQM
jgi:UDP-3-O-[3-hydroxymyristoyl] N-acetylglucosamine deacetylase/3-hydroxyacyl-[acyl-carrier-protein] dehydratase